MNIISACIANPVKVAVSVILLTLFGVIAIVRLPTQLSPDVELPRVTVNTIWPGASPQEIENEIVREQEEQLKSVEGVTKMSSECSDSSGTITLEFRVGTNLQEALLKVNSRLQQVAEYPVDAEKPVIRTSDPGDNAIAWFILSARAADDEQIRAFGAAHPEHSDEIARILRSHNDGLKVHRLYKLAEKAPAAKALLPADIDVTKKRQFAEEVIEPALERVPGVADCGIFGGNEPELQVIVDADKLAARGLTIADVRRALTEDNKDISAGDIWDSKRRYLVRTLGEYRSEEQVRGQLIAAPNGNPVYIADVATVNLGFKKPSGFVRRYGISNIAVNCQRETGANVIAVMDGLGEALQRLNDGPLKREGLILNQVYDETEYIHSAIGLVKDNIILGSSLTVIVLMMFLHLNARTLLFVPLLAASAFLALSVSPWFFLLSLGLILGAGLWFARGALVVALSIPISIVGTFLILQLLGRSLNVISLAGLSFAVGMLVDNSIVVLENIYSFFQRGHNPREAAEKAAGEVWGAVFASTVTTLAIFMPVVFLEGEVGQLFVDIALAISAAVGLSLIVSIIVIPTAASRLLSENHAAETVGPVHRFFARMGSGVVQFFETINRWTHRSVGRRIGTVAVLVGAALAGSWLLRPPVEYLPQGNRNLIISLVLPPPGLNVNEMETMGKTLEAKMEKYWDYDLGYDTEQLDYPPIEDLFCVAFGRMIFFGISSQDPLQAGKLIGLINAELNGILPGSYVVAFQTSLFSDALSGGRAIDLEITGPELEKLVALGGQVMMQAGPLLPGAQMRPIPGLDLSNPELHVHRRERQASDMEMSTIELGYAINALIDGAYVTDYFDHGNKIDLVILADEKHEGSFQDLASQYVATPNMTEPVRLDALAVIKPGFGPEQIARRERQRAITIQITPPESMPLEQAVNLLNASIIQPLEASGELGSLYQINLSGTADKLRNTWSALWGNFVLAILITYLLLAALFESWTNPIVIILSVPLGAVGGLLGLKMLGYYLMLQGGVPQALDVLTMLGFVILVGTVVNNPILLVHHALYLIREHQYALVPAVLESVRSRIRPIFMTTITTIFGLAPLVLFPGAGSELYRGLGSVLLGGLLVSTIFTLVLVPSMFSLAYQLFSWIQRKPVVYDSRSAAPPAPSRLSRPPTELEPVEVG